MYFVLKFNWIVVLGAAILVPFITHYLPYDLYSNFQYSAIFVGGALLAKHRISLMEHYKSLGRPLKVGLAVTAFILYNYNWILTGLFASQSDLRDSLIVSSGASIFVITCLASRSLLAVLHNRFILFLGKISYSLYLYHAIIMLSMVHALYGKLAIQFILVIAFVVSLGVSTMLYYLIERPSIRYGRYLSERFFPAATPSYRQLPAFIPANGPVAPSHSTAGETPTATTAATASADIVLTTIPAAEAMPVPGTVLSQPTRLSENENDISSSFEAESLKPQPQSHPDKSVVSVSDITVFTTPDLEPEGEVEAGR